MKLRPILLAFILLVLIGLWFRQYRLGQPAAREDIHYHAGFLVYVDGKPQDFSDNKYMDIEPCTVGGKEVKHEDEDQLEKAHLHDRVGDVVHVHRQGAVWRDLFKNIRYDFPAGKPVTGYISGKKVAGILEAKILPDESVVIIVGEENGTDINKTVSITRIREIEKKSETCGTTASS